MFTMMNNARLSVGLQGLALSERAFQMAGYIEATGVAQHFRDARIAPIYEGTNGIQAMDLVGRKLAMGGGAAVGDYLDHIASADAALEVRGDELASIRSARPMAWGP